MRKREKVPWLRGADTAVLAALCLAVWLPASAQQTTKAADEPQAIASTSANSAELPDSPGTVVARLAEGAQQNTISAPQQSSAPSSPAQNQSQPSQPQIVPQKPVGTATAEAPTTTGIAASQPAGAAIAPAKQHRVRTIVLRTGAIIGAAVAVGTVVALAEATPSKPPGAH